MLQICTIKINKHTLMFRVHSKPLVSIIHQKLKPKAVVHDILKIINWFLEEFVIIDFENFQCVIKRNNDDRGIIHYEYKTFIYACLFNGLIYKFL